MTFEQFQSWLLINFNPNNELCFQTLGGRSRFHVRYDGQSRVMKIRRSTGNEGQVRNDEVYRIFQRYWNAPQSEKNMSSFYTDPLWEETPSRILAPYVAAVIKAWIDER